MVRSTDVPVYVKPGVPNRVRSLPFQIQLAPAQLIASFNAQKGLFLVDYLLTATARRKCPKTGWNLLKLETRTFVTITPPEMSIEKPFHVTPYSPPLDNMDLFRCPFMQTIRVQPVLFPVLIAVQLLVKTDHLCLVARSQDVPLLPSATL